MMGYAFGSAVNWWWALGLGLLRLLLAAGLVILLVRIFKKNKSSYSFDKAIKMLKERYAAGEINEEEYKKKLNTLRKEV